VHCKSFPGKQLRRIHDANADVPATCGIAVFIVILARCRIVEFLGHAPDTVADSHYVKPNQERFDGAVNWLRDQFL
jgi:hypothetical protein